jgi:predicted dithiol-disulfide oxidoreductase (DUF899 family)
MQNQVISHEEWLKARLKLLAAENDAPPNGDALGACGKVLSI